VKQALECDLHGIDEAAVRRPDEKGSIAPAIHVEILLRLMASMDRPIDEPVERKPASKFR